MTENTSIATAFFMALEQSKTRATLLTWTDKEGEGSVIIDGYVDLSKAATLFLAHLKTGRLLVNYYPFSRKRSAYVGGTTKAETQVSPSRAVAMAFDAPDLAGKPTKRRKNSRWRRVGLIKAKGPNCHWCQALLTLDSSTLDHVIPLSRGGLDNANNVVLSCKPCNHARGNSMPEIQS